MSIFKKVGSIGTILGNSSVDMWGYVYSKYTYETNQQLTVEQAEVIFTVKEDFNIYGNNPFCIPDNSTF